MNNKANAVIGNWILIGIGMLTIQVLLGGITRLTGSGLSITEWKPIMGTIPPLNEIEWQQAFDKYKQIAQYQYLNQHFTLPDFKFIFFWEWFHRLWARLIGLVFLFPFIYFLVKRYITPSIAAKLVILFVMGALQGAVGWIMVKSGINQVNVFVNHIKLAAHFISAMILIAYALQVALSLKYAGNEHKLHASSSFKKNTVLIVLVIIVQLVFGAFMAGLKAAAAAPTWPLINGSFLPWFVVNKDGLKALIFNPIGVHLVHRMLAYLLLALIIWWFYKASQLNGFNRVKKYMVLPVALLLVQITLGVMAVLYSITIIPGHFSVFEWIALAHQLVGMLLALSFWQAYYFLNGKR